MKTYELLIDINQILGFKMGSLFCFEHEVFQALQSAIFKNEKKNPLKKDASHLSIVWHSGIQKKNIEKRE